MQISHPVSGLSPGCLKQKCPTMRLVSDPSQAEAVQHPGGNVERIQGQTLKGPVESLCFLILR